MAFWSEVGHDKEDLLQAPVDFLRPRKVQVAVDQGWRAWDLDVHAGLWAHVALLTAVEYHGGNTRLLRVRCASRTSFWARITLAALFTAAVEMAADGPVAGAVVAGLATAVATGLVARSVLAAGRMMSQVVAIVADRLGLVPIAEPRTGRG
jgi:hypothetical protein